MCERPRVCLYLFVCVCSMKSVQPNQSVERSAWPTECFG